MLTIRLCNAEEMIGNKDFPLLGEEYKDESRNLKLPAPQPDFEMYRHLVSSGVLHVVGAFKNDCVVGIMTILYSKLPHYGIPVALSESFFVSKRARSGGTGLKLLAFGEDYALNLGSPGFYITAPFASRLAKLLPRKGYGLANYVYFKDFRHE